MPPSIQPAPFYGDNRVSDDYIRHLRLYRSNLLDEEMKKQRKSKCPAPKSRFTGVKLFSGVGHNIKKPKLKKLKVSPKEKRRVSGSTVKPSIRQMMRNHFDFSRTPYAIPKRQRVALSEETSKKRKFFKSTVETPEAKKPKLTEQVVSLEFEDMNDVEEEPFADIRKDVSSILTDWLDDEESMKPQMTRQKAGVLDDGTSNSGISYLTSSAHAHRIYDTANATPTVSICDTDSSMALHTPVRTPGAVAETPSTPTNTPVVSINTPTTSTSSPEGFNTPVTLASKTKAHTATPGTPNTPRGKLYSIFATPPLSKNVLSDVTNRITKSQTLLNKAAAPNDQYQIDAGQKVIGPKECSICGMVYDIGDPVDEKRHAAYHAKRNELKYKALKTENVVGFVDNDRIILIKYTDDKKRKKVEEILKVTEEEIGCGYTFQRSSVAFIYVRNDHVLGCLIAEPRTRANRVIKSDGIVLLSEMTEPVKCGINRIWVKQDYRGQNIGTEMVNCLRKNFGYGEYLKTEDIAFSATTPDGHKFAKKYTGRDDYLTYLDPNVN